MTDEQRTEVEEVEEVEEIEGEEGSSRRSFMKKGAAAAGAVALGTAASAGNAAAQPSGRYLISTNQYYPGNPWDVLAPIPASTVVSILTRAPRPPEITSPDEYSGYVIRYRRINTTAMVYTRDGTLPQNPPQSRNLRWNDDAQVFSAALNLLQVTPA